MNRYRKKELLSLPLPRAEWDPALRIESGGLGVTAQIAEHKGIQLLVIDIYSEIYTLIYTIYCDHGRHYKPDDNRTAAFTTYSHLNKRWSEACLCNLIGWEYYCIKVTYVPGTTAVTAEYFTDPVERLALDCLDSFQLGMRDYRLQLQTENRRSTIDALMDTVAPLPDDINKYIDDVLLKHSRYIYYQRKRNTIHGYCTYCRQDITMPAPKGRLVDKKGICPGCRSDIIFKSPNMSALISDEESFQYICRVQDGIMVTKYDAVRMHCRDSYRKGYKQIIDSSVRTHIRFNCTGKHYVHESRNCKYDQGIKWFPSDRRLEEIEIFEMIYPSDLSDVLSATPWRYCGLDYYAKSNNAINAHAYIHAWAQHPIIERLVKVGLYNIAKGIVYNNGDLQAVLSASRKNKSIGIREALEENMDGIRFLADINADAEEYNFIKLCRENNKRCNAEDIDALRELNLLAYLIDRNIAKLIRQTTVYKICKYVSEQYYAEDNKHYNHPHSVAIDWADYIRDCQKLGLNLSDQGILMPRKLHEAHERTTEQIEIIVNQETDEAIANQLPMLNKRYYYADDKYIIRPAESAEELAIEGAELGHCVGSYADKMASGDCTILLIRRAAEPDKPYVTAEVDYDQAIQLRGKNNEIPDDEINKLWDKYKKNILSKVDRYEDEPIIMKVGA